MEDDQEEKDTRELSGEMENFNIVIGMQVTWEYSFVKIVQLIFVYFNVQKIPKRTNSKNSNNCAGVGAGERDRDKT